MKLMRYALFLTCLIFVSRAWCQTAAGYFDKAKTLESNRQFKEAVYWYAKGAAMKDESCLNALNRLLLTESVFGDDYQDYRYLYNNLTALEEQSPNGIVETYIGWLFDAGHGVQQSYDVAFKWYEEAANRGAALAQNRLGIMYENGIGRDSDYIRAAYWYKLASNQGFAAGQANYGRMLVYGRGIDKDAAAGRELLLKSAAQGNTFAMYHLGRVYFYGYGVSQDGDAACTWFKKSAYGGYPRAMNMLASAYEKGSGVSMDMDSAKYWYGKAADKNVGDAMVSLARLLLWGNAPTGDRGQDLADAKRYLERADSLGSIEAPFELGYMYYFGWYFDKDIDNAISNFERSADKGYDSAMMRLGDIYWHAGPKRNFEKAQDWYRMAAETHNPVAMCQYGTILQVNSFRPTTAECATMVGWMTKSYEAGYAWASLALEVFYQVSACKDRKNAKYWGEKFGAIDHKQPEYQELPDIKF